MLPDKQAFALPLKEDFRTLLGLFTTLSLSVNHVYTTETLGKELGKEQRTLCKGFTNKNFKYIPVHWDKCQAKSGKLMFMANHMLKLKLQYFGHLMRRVDSLEKTLMLGGIRGRRRRG